MYWNDYLWFMGAILICLLLSAIASSKVRSTYAKHDRVRCRSGMTGYDAATHLLQSNNISHISVGSVGGTLSDHYNPGKGIVNLSESTYRSNSVAAVAVAAHEIGHVMQNKNGYLFYRFRTALVPVVNFGSRLSMPLVLIGLLLDWYSATTTPDIGFKVAMAGVILYGGSLLFALITLPVELNASRRAKNMLLAEGILTQDELPAASQVLSAAAMTYFVSLLTTLVYFLRFMLRVLTLFGRRSNRR